MNNCNFRCKICNKENDISEAEFTVWDRNQSSKITICKTCFKSMQMCGATTIVEYVIIQKALINGQ